MIHKYNNDYILRMPSWYIWCQLHPKMQVCKWNVQLIWWKLSLLPTVFRRIVQWTYGTIELCLCNGSIMFSMYVSLAICSPTCKNSGNCIAPDLCLCQETYSGLSCETREHTVTTSSCRITVCLQVSALQIIALTVAHVLWILILTYLAGS